MFPVCYFKCSSRTYYNSTIHVNKHWFFYRVNIFDFIAKENLFITSQIIFYLVNINEIFFIKPRHFLIMIYDFMWWKIIFTNIIFSIHHCVNYSMINHVTKISFSFFSTSFFFWIHYQNSMEIFTSCLLYLMTKFLPNFKTITQF